MTSPEKGSHDKSNSWSRLARCTGLIVAPAAACHGPEQTGVVNRARPMAMTIQEGTAARNRQVVNQCMMDSQLHSRTGHATLQGSDH